MRTLQIYLDTCPLEVEVAVSLSEKRRGLQGRASLTDDQGMLFLFDPPEQVGVGMQGVTFAISVGFITPAGQLLKIVDLAPEQPEICRAPAPVSAFLEVPQGWFERRGLAPGCRVVYQRPAPRRIGFRFPD